MLRLLNIELQKLRYNRSARVISIIYFVLITFIALIASIEFDFGSIHFRVADQGIFQFSLYLAFQYLYCRNPETVFGHRNRFNDEQ